MKRLRILSALLALLLAVHVAPARAEKAVYWESNMTFEYTASYPLTETDAGHVLLSLGDFSRIEVFLAFCPDSVQYLEGVAFRALMEESDKLLTSPSQPARLSAGERRVFAFDYTTRELWGECGHTVCAETWVCIPGGGCVVMEATYPPDERQTVLAELDHIIDTFSVLLPLL